MFLGEFEHALDERGRLAIPAKFRPALAEGMVVTKGIDRCLVIWTMDDWRAFTDDLRQMPLMAGDARRMQRFFLAGAADAVPDRLGRILIPAPLRAYAQLADQAVVIGVGDRVEIWSTANWEQERSSAEDQSSELAEHLFTLGVSR
jgi:MraZ protein